MIVGYKRNKIGCWQQGYGLKIDTTTMVYGHDISGKAKG